MGTGDQIKRIYQGFRGVDFRGEECSLIRSPDSLNVWKDYREIDGIRTRPGMELRTAFDAPVYGIFHYHGERLVHSGTKLYRARGDSVEVLFDAMNEARSESFTYEDTWYIKDGRNYLRYAGEAVSRVEGFVPTTSIGRKPAGGGTVFQDVNMLTPGRINTFLADGESVAFHLDAMGLDEDFRPIVTVNGEETEDFSVDYACGVITFKNAPPAPLTDGQDNVAIEFRKTTEGHSGRILNCTLLQVFDNRVFFSGNPDFPNVVWHCSLNDPGYCSDLDYYQEGMDESPIRGLVAGNNALWVFREPSDANTNVFYHTPLTDEEYGKIYPSSHSSVTTGCVGRAVNFNDDIVFFSERGMEGISQDITTEQAVTHRSSMVDRVLLTEPAYREMILAEWEGYLLAFVGSRAYLADSRTAFPHENHVEYEWFFWEMGKEITSACVESGVLYLGTADGVYSLTDKTGAVESWWITPKDKFNHPSMLKTTNKRGCVAEATGDIDVFAKLEDTDFELVGTFRGVTDHFVSRIKRKKFKDIQLKFYTKTRFSIETVTLEAWIGGYIKR